MKKAPGNISARRANGPGPVTTPLLARVGVLAFSVVLAATLIFYPGPCRAKEITVVQADGTAVKTAEVKDVKEAAIDTALKNAVADVLEGIIENEALEVDPSLVETNIYANAVNFVVNFKILSEERLTDEIEVLPEGNADKGEDASGIQPIVPESELPPPPPPEVRIVESYHIWLEARIDTVLLKDALGKIVLSSEGSSPAISIVLLDVTDFETFNTIKQALERVTMLKDVTYDSFYPGRFVFSARTAGQARTLASKIAHEAGNDFIVARGGKATIIIKAYPKAFSID